MRRRHRGDGDRPFAARLAGGGGENGRRQAQRRAQQLIFRARSAGHSLLADWLADGFRTGTLTDDGAAGDPSRIAATLAAVRLCRFTDGADGRGHPDCSATLVFDHTDLGGAVREPAVTEVELASVEAGELHGHLLAAAFGVGTGSALFRLRYFGITEIAPESTAGNTTGDAPGTLDVWESTAPSLRADQPGGGSQVFRVRFGWSDDADRIYLARLEQRFTRAAAPRRDARRLAARGRLHLHGSPSLRPVSDSRLAADRWDRVLLDGFVANQLVAYLTRRTGQSN